MIYRFAVLAIMLAPACLCLADNPIIQTIYTADPAPFVYNGTVYLYTGHDEDNSKYFVMKDWRCYSSKDMVNWTDHGSPLSLTTFAWAKSDAWAGQCIERDGKFYWYVPIQRKQGGMVIGVAISDGPTGPFKDAIGKPLVVDNWGDIDPTVFIDDDGQAYLYWGNPTLKYVKLNKDMISYDLTVGDKGIVRGPMTIEAFGKRQGNVPPERTTLYEEGPWLYKRNSLYYMIYAGGPVPEHIAYSTSSSPTGPWLYGGTIMPTQGRSFTNHPGVIDFKGHTFLFYHNGALPGGGGFTRSVCLDELKFNSDGSIPKLDMTKTGPAAVASLNPYERVEAETIAWESGIKTELNDQVGMVVHDIDNDDYIKVKNVDFGSPGATTFTASIVKSDHPKASKCALVELRLDRTDGTLIGTLSVPYTDSQWMTPTTTVAGATGVHDLFLVFKGEATGDLFKFDSWQFGRNTTRTELVAINATADRYKLDALPPNNKAALHLVAVYSDGTSKDITRHAKVEPDKAGIAGVYSGNVTAQAAGTVKLAVSYDGKTQSFPIVVKDLKSEFTVRTLTPNVSQLKLINGSTTTYTVTAEYLDGHVEDVTKRADYDSATPEVATVANCLIRAVKHGSTTIRIRFKDEVGEYVTTQIAVSVTDRDPYAQNEAEEFNEHTGLAIQSNNEAGQFVCDASNGEWLKFNALDFGSGAKSFEMRIASATKGGAIEIHLDSVDGPLVGTCKAGNTGGWQRWVTRTCEVDGAVGRHDVYFKFTGGSGLLFNLNWWKFVK